MRPVRSNARSYWLTIYGTASHVVVGYTLLTAGGIPVKRVQTDLDDGGCHKSVPTNQVFSGARKDEMGDLNPELVDNALSMAEHDLLVGRGVRTQEAHNHEK